MKRATNRRSPAPLHAGRIMIAVILAATAPLLGCSDWEPPATRTDYFDNQMMGSILAPDAPDSAADSIESSPAPPGGQEVSPSDAVPGSVGGSEREESIPSSLRSRFKWVR